MRTLPVCVILALVLYACTPQQDTSQLSQAARAGGGPRDDDDDDEREVDDDDGDRDCGRELGVDCARVRRGTRARRTSSQRRTEREFVRALRRSSPHRHVPLRSLIEFMRPADGHGAPVEAGERREMQRTTAMLLCDPATREIVTTEYLARYSEYRLPGGAR